MKSSPKQLANLKNGKRFEPGNKLGLGRPKKITSLESLIRSVVSDDDWEKIIRAIKLKAMKGNENSANLLLDRMYGRPKQSLIVGEQPVINITHSVVSLDEVRKNLPSHENG